MQINKAVTIRGRMNRSKGMPADLIATNSKVSPRFPKVIIEESKTARGRDKGTMVAATKEIN